MDRRQLLKGVAAGGLLAGLTGVGKAQAAEADGTPMQFMPKTPKDPNPQENDVEKHSNCPYCGMSRKKFSHTRHLIHYSDDLADGTCSIHCASVSLSLNLDRHPKAIYVGDAGSQAEIKPLVPVEEAHYVIQPGKMGTMTRRRKYAYADAATAEQVAATEGGEVVDFDNALLASYVDMAEDTIAIRKRRAEKRKKGGMKMMKHGH